METPTVLAAGVVLSLFGSALLLWCASELRLRHHLRAHGVPTVAEVVEEDDPAAELDSAPLLVYCTLPSVGTGAGAAGRAETVLARPCGHTPLRRPARLIPGTTVPVAYDARRPGRVVLAASEAVSTLPGDLFWALFGVGALAGGLSLLGSLLTG